ncbi:DNA polymerase III subunit alpha [Nocardioides yefusunii]|uniref:DNA polymerase III subunit alpha n=1 Tax=Nocardioides yefusunii TaxID=2500546 RepID=A0ABW1QXG8_9ACTN|nr:DNA polymerase III subunit alpha [Nocardioides yefusunii]
MRDSFVHLHVASGHSLRYGASTPQRLAERAAEHGMDLLALTDRDGTYGAVKFARAAQRVGIAPVLGVDLAVDLGLTPPQRRDESSATRRSPVRGGAARTEHHTRAVFLARGRQGWAALCRMVSAAHLGSERGRPVATRDVLAQHLGDGHLEVLLGPWSGIGDAVARGSESQALREWAEWRSFVPGERLHLELVSHLSGGRQFDWGRGWSLTSTVHAGRTARFAGSVGASTVLSNAVRFADRDDALVVDVLDAARRLVPLDRRTVERTNAEGNLKSGAEMRRVAEEICRAAGDEDGASALLDRTRAVAEGCALDLRDDLGIGSVHFPEFELVRRDGLTPMPVAGESPADAQLRARCEAAVGWRYGQSPRQRIWKRLHDELDVIARLGYASYFLAVDEVTDLVRGLGIRAAARGSGAGSLVNYLLGISGVDPLRHGLLMERFLSPLRRSLPDIDIDVESARRGEIYDAVLQRFGAERCVCVSMAETYRVRHAVRDVGAALGVPPAEIDAIAKAFPHVRARDARSALADLPELRASGLAEERLSLMFSLVERLDGLPRSIALHPCGVLLSDTTLLDRTAVESSSVGHPMSQFDKDDVEEMGLLKLDLLGIRMQSAMAHAVAEVARVDDVNLDLDDPTCVPFDDEATYGLISSARTLGVFQIESPGQRELVGKSGVHTFEEVIADISLFRPGPVKSDMIRPYLDAKQGWSPARYLHPDLKPVLESSHGVVVFHEQVIEIIAILAGVNNAEGDEKRRALGTLDGMAEVKQWFVPRALQRGYPAAVVEEVWAVLEAFASFGFCKAHAAAFALPTYQSAWLKTHWPAHFLAGVLTHDPGMYPKRLILDDARHFGIGVRGLDVDLSDATYRVERSETDPAGYAIRLALAEVRGIDEAEVARIVAGRPYGSLADFWHRARVSRPVVERLVLTGAFDRIHGIGPGTSGVTRRDLLLRVAELDRLGRVEDRAARGRGISAARRAAAPGTARPRQTAPESVQLSLGIEETEVVSSGLPELTDAERTAAELEVLGLDVTTHVLAPWQEMLDALGVVRSRDLLTLRSNTEVLVAGVKVAAQTPPVRSGRRVLFLTLDDSTGPVDATFFEDVQAPYATTVFSHWMVLVRGVVRRTGPRGVSLRATGAWALDTVHEHWSSAADPESGVMAVRALLETPVPSAGMPEHRRVLVHSSGAKVSPYADVRPAGGSLMAPARSLWHRSAGSPG